MDKVEELAEYLRALVEEGGTGNRLIVSGGRGWAVFSASKGDADVIAELATNQHLTGEDRLDDAQLQIIRAAGFIRTARGDKRLRQAFAVQAPGDEAIAADKVTGLMTRVYGADPQALHLQLALGDVLDVENPRLSMAMRKVSKVRTHNARMELYQEMINATFLMVVESAGGLKPKVIDHMGPWEVFAVFTDEDSIRLYDPRGVAVRKLYGHELFPLLMGTQLGSLKINPNGNIGGELYRNEVQTIADAVARFTGPRSQ
ncbi:MAG: SseB family protein [Myxococcota bacterium]